MTPSRDPVRLRQGLNPLTTTSLGPFLSQHHSTPMSAVSMAASHAHAQTPASAIQPYNPQEWIASPAPGPERMAQSFSPESQGKMHCRQSRSCHAVVFQMLINDPRVASCSAAASLQSSKEPAASPDQRFVREQPRVRLVSDYEPQHASALAGLANERFLSTASGFWWTGRFPRASIWVAILEQAKRPRAGHRHSRAFALFASGAAGHESGSCPCYGA